MICECKKCSSEVCSNNVLSREQQRNIAEAIATVDKVIQAAQRHFGCLPEYERLQQSALYINSCIALLAAVK
ncbi:MAG: hypothetical protein PHP00_06850 [Thiotrichaceae bacterium]|nr:hypothetical protein [Thiotrichaceae bacterium]